MRFFLRAILLAWVALLCACGKKEEVRTYDIPKEAVAPMPAPASMTTNAGTEAPTAAAPMMPASGGAPMQALPGMVEQSAQFDTPTWIAPESWQPQPLGSMRKGSWKIEANGKTAEVSVLVFPGSVGGDLANVNRWADQVGATPLTEEQLAQVKADNAQLIDNHQAFYVDLQGPGGKSIRGVILPYHGGTWFFKLQGDTELVSAEAVHFAEFMSTVQFPAH